MPLNSHRNKNIISATLRYSYSLLVLFQILLANSVWKVVFFCWNMIVYIIWCGNVEKVILRVYKIILYTNGNAEYLLYLCVKTISIDTNMLISVLFKHNLLFSPSKNPFPEDHSIVSLSGLIDL